MVLSDRAAAALLRARAAGETRARVSLDLNRSVDEVALGTDGARLPDGTLLPWAAVEEIAAHEHACYLVEEGRAERIAKYSSAFRRQYSLRATDGAPTMLLAGFPMHRIKGVDPMEDTRRKLATVAPVTGRVLDTTTGLGYTAIMAAESAQEVVTIELDPRVLEIARANPWSQSLFASPKIRQLTGSAFDVVPTLEDAAFNRILHDPPSFKLAGELYSAEFYAHLRRVLRRGGKLFHYIGDLESASGAGVTRGVVRRLHEAGFERVARAPEAFGVTAW